MIRFTRTLTALPVVILALGWPNASTAKVGPLYVVTGEPVYQGRRVNASFEHFTAATGIDVRVRSHKDIVTELRKQIGSEQVRWDVVNLPAPNGLRACAEGLLEPISANRLESGSDGTPAESDFLEGALTRCGVADLADSTALAFNASRYGSEQPSSVNALFDIERFPGTRALQREPIPLLLWALRSYGVPQQEVYSLLGTPRGMNLAFARFDKIKDHIIWRENTASVVDLLADDEIVMGSGRMRLFLNVSAFKGHSIKLLGVAQLYDYSIWGIPRGAPYANAAFEFIRFVTGFEAGIDKVIPSRSIPAIKSALDFLRPNTPIARSLGPHMRSYSTSIDLVSPRGNEWDDRTRKYINKRFKTWLEGRETHNKSPG